MKGKEGERERASRDENDNENFREEAEESEAFSAGEFSLEGFGGDEDGKGDGGDEEGEAVGISEAVPFNSDQYSLALGRKRGGEKEGRSALRQNERALLQQARGCTVHLCETMLESQDGDGLCDENDDSDGGHEAPKEGLQGEEERHQYVDGKGSRERMGNVRERVRHRGNRGGRNRA